MSDVREFYARKQPDGHWFDKGSMRFFNTKLPRNAYEGDAGILFVTSEVDPSGHKAYSIRRQLPDGDIATVGNFHAYPTRADAMLVVRMMHKGEVSA
jgi:hypothetical protein